MAITTRARIASETVELRLGTPAISATIYLRSETGEFRIYYCIQKTVISEVNIMYQVKKTTILVIMFINNLHRIIRMTFFLFLLPETDFVLSGNTSIFSGRISRISG